MGVIFGIVLVLAAGFLVWKFPPNMFLEILVVAFMFLGLWMIKGKFLAILVLGLPILYRLDLLNLVTVAIWLLVLGLTALIN